MYAFNGAERVNRLATAIGSYKAARLPTAKGGPGMSHEAAIAKTPQATKGTAAKHVPIDQKQRRRRDSNPRDDFSPNGFQDRLPDDVSSEPTTTYDDQGNALTAALTGKPIPPDIGTVVHAWPDLPEHIRKAIVTLVEGVSRDD